MSVLPAKNKIVQTIFLYILLNYFHVDAFLCTQLVIYEVFTLQGDKLPKMVTTKYTWSHFQWVIRLKINSSWKRVVDITKLINITVNGFDAKKSVRYKRVLVLTELAERGNECNTSTSARIGDWQKIMEHHYVLSNNYNVTYHISQQCKPQLIQCKQDTVQGHIQLSAMQLVLPWQRGFNIQSIHNGDSIECGCFSSFNSNPGKNSNF